ncbi:28630_t:CDS:2, partial [Racocetra persica]
DYIEYILNNPTIASNLYFGPGIVCDEIREFWHDILWQNSLLFGETKLCVNNITYQAGNFLRYHQDKAIKFAYIRSVVEVNKRQLLRADPLVPYKQKCLIIPENITQINVWLKDLDRP